MRPMPRNEWALVAILAAAAILFFRPGEMIFGNRDYGVYVAAGNMIADQGRYVIVDEGYLELGEAARRAVGDFMRPGAGGKATLHSGFFLTDRETGEITPQFPPVYPLWIAAADLIADFNAVRAVTPLIGLLSAATLFLLMRSHLGAVVALAATGLFVTQLPQIWYSRNLFSEVPAQFLVIGSVWILSIAAKHKSWALSLLGATLWMLSAFARIDMLVVGLGIVAGIAVSRALDEDVRRRLIYGGQAVFIVALAGAPLAYYATLGSGYFEVVRQGALVNFGPADFPIPLLAALVWVTLPMAVLASSLFVSLLIRRRVQSHLFRNRAYRFALAALIALAISYPAFVRPFGDDSTARLGFLWLSWYLSPLGVVISVAGIALLAYRISRRGLSTSAPLVGAFLATALILSWQPSVGLDHFWAIRRFVPTVLPGFAVLTAYFVYRFVQSRWRQAGLIAPGIAVAGLVGFQLFTLAPFLDHREHQGSHGGVAEIADAIGEDDIVLMDPRSLQEVALPLQFLFGRTVINIQVERIESALDSEIETWQSSGRNVYLLVGSREAPLLARYVKTDQERQEGAVRVRRSKPTYSSRPSQVEVWSLPYTLLKLAVR